MKTILGVISISFGLAVYPPLVLNSIFMNEAFDHDLDIGIVNYYNIYYLRNSSQVRVDFARKLIFRDVSDGGSAAGGTCSTSPV